MKSLAYLVAFLLSIVIIGGPLALALTFIRTSRRGYTYTRQITSIVISILSIGVGSILMLSGGAVASVFLGFIGVSTGLFAMYRTVTQIRQ